MDLVREVGEMALCDIGKRQRGEVGVAEREHPRSKEELALIAADVAQRLEREERTSRGCSGEASLTCHFREGKSWPRVREAANYRKAAFQGVHKAGWTADRIDHGVRAPEISIWRANTAKPPAFVIDVDSLLFRRDAWFDVVRTTVRY